MSNVPNDPNRGTGRTTALLLHAIAEALEHPNTWIPFQDHANHTDPELFANALANMANNLRLTMRVRIHANQAWIMSPIATIREARAKREAGR